MDSNFERLKILKHSGFELECALDIGAYRGDFTRMLLNLWPNASIQQFDADDRNKSFLNHNAKIAVLGNEEKLVDIHLIDDMGSGSTTGTSIFKEKSSFYSNSYTKQCKMKLLDDLVDFKGDWSKGLIKIDTQGSELLVLEGAKKFLKLNPKFILLECSFVEYNSGSPLIVDVFEYMKKINYVPVDITELMYDNGYLIQSNVLFEKY